MKKNLNMTVDYLQKYRFDGLDIYWNMSSSDLPDATFFSALRTALEKHNLLLSLALYTELKEDGILLQLFGSSVSTAWTELILYIYYITVIYFMEIILNHIDFVSVLAYDFWGSTQHFWQADYPAPLYSIRSGNVDSIIHYFLEHDMPAAKINLGIPMYGGTWTIPASSKLEPPISATWGPINKHTGILGQMPYFDICSSIRSSGWLLFGKDNNSTGPYAVSPEQMGSNKIWVGFDDVGTVVTKSDYAKNIRSLGGVTVWDLSQDDFRNTCGKGPYHLTAAISRTLGIHRTASSAFSVRLGLSTIMFFTVAWGLVYYLL